VAAARERGGGEEEEAVSTTTININSSACFGQYISLMPY